MLRLTAINASYGKQCTQSKRAYRAQTPGLFRMAACSPGLLSACCKAGSSVVAACSAFSRRDAPPWTNNAHSVCCSQSLCLPSSTHFMGLDASCMQSSETCQLCSIVYHMQSKLLVKQPAREHCHQAGTPCLCAAPTFVYFASRAALCMRTCDLQQAER